MNGDDEFSPPAGSARKEGWTNESPQHVYHIVIDVDLLFQSIKSYAIGLLEMHI